MAPIGSGKPDNPKVVPGRPIRIHVRLAYFDSKDPLPAVLHGQYGVAILDDLTRDEYPFPSKPADLTPLPSPNMGDGRWITPADPRPVTFTWEKSIGVKIAMQTPGRLTLQVNGVTATTVDSWDYGAHEHDDCLVGSALHLHPGDRVTLTVWSEFTEGDWRVIVDPVGMLCSMS